MVGHLNTVLSLVKHLKDPSHLVDGESIITYNEHSWAEVTAYSVDREILYVGRSNGMICPIRINNPGLLSRIMEGRLGMISRFINFDAIVPFKTWFNQDTEYLLTIRRYLATNGTPKAMLNIYDLHHGKMISNENYMEPKNNSCHPEVNDACLIDSGIEEFS